MSSPFRGRWPEGPEGALRTKSSPFRGLLPVQVATASGQPDDFK